MKSRIIKIIGGASVLLFVFSSLTFAHGLDKRHHGPKGKANGHFKTEKRYIGWYKKQVRPWKHYREHHRKRHFAGYYCKDGFYQHYDRKSRRWRIHKFKSRHLSRYRYGYKNRHRIHDNYYRRHAFREDLIYKVALKDPNIVFKVIRKRHQ